MDSMQRFLAKLRELIRGKVKSADLTSDEFDECVRQARSHVGGTVRWEKAREVEAALVAKEFAESYSGLMVGYWLPEHSAQQLAIKNGEAPATLHLTLCYCGDVQALGEVAIARALVTVEELARQTAPISGQVSGYGRFSASNTSDGKDVIYASVDMPELSVFRERLVEVLTMAGCAPRTDHGYTPHITIAYVEPESKTPNLPLTSMQLRMDRLMFAAGDKRVELLLTGMDDMMGGSRMNEWKLLGELSLAEDKKSARIQIFPKVHKYDHPRYGELNVSPDFLKEVKANFDARVYQQDLPLTIDLEHESKLSGAAGWIKDVEVNGEQGMFATIEFNDRGQSLVADGGFKYFSPEFYDTWVDPATGRQYSNVLIGGALTNRPFFKGMAPVAMMREGALLFVESAEDMGDMDDMDAMMRAMQSMMAMMGKGMMPDKEMMAEMEGMMAEMKKAMPKGDKAMAEKTEDGNAYTKGDYLYAPTDQPNDWKLRIAEYVDGAKKVTKAQLGRAAAALGKGFRGNKVELPDGMHTKMVAKLKGMYSQMGVKPDDMPAMMASLVEAGLSEEDASASLVELGLGESTGGDAMGMTEDEVRQLGEMQASVKSLNERLAAEAEARKASEIRATAAEEEAKKAREIVAAMERQDKLRSFREFVREHRLGFQGEVEEATERLMRFSTSMAAEDFTAYLDERKAHHEQMKASVLLGEVGHAGTAPKGVAAEFDAAIAKAMQEGNLDKAAATVKVANENPGLYKRYDDAFKATIKRGGE